MTATTARTVVVAIDGSDHAARAAAAAVELFGDRATYVLVRAVDVIPAVSPTGRLAAGSLEALRDQERATATAELDAVAATLPVPVTAVVADGSPAAAIVQTAIERDATVIVVGSRGLGAVKRALLGSVSTAVLRDADRPVLVVPAGGRPTEG